MKKTIAMAAALAAAAVMVAQAGEGCCSKSGADTAKAKDYLAASKAAMCNPACLKGLDLTDAQMAKVKALQEACAKDECTAECMAKCRKGMAEELSPEQMTKWKAAYKEMKASCMGMESPCGAMKDVAKDAEKAAGEAEKAASGAVKDVEKAASEAVETK